jgi:hypothetical protein
MPMHLKTKVDAMQTQAKNVMAYAFIILLLCYNWLHKKPARKTFASFL